MAVPEVPRPSSVERTNSIGLRVFRGAVDDLVARPTDSSAHGELGMCEAAVSIEGTHGARVAIAMLQPA
ncbi:MAG: hypothetical protein JOZ91_09245 [Candidatus Eremiobacteraeota bacterium]|nr:hypothetical protein [Candidatus Eremiobacteraeota bacterium]MBV8204941.1 hypothetical protein [Candidatus Eremiobacteraeota bacterium]MBV8339147.1 hypothetical protein [Candidatus Eremiobacteraeota bacterium]MBV8668666.1 hypothetical protein [Candidatus Eremiobacteraeota bacterium]